MLILDADTVRRLLPMPDCIEAMEQAMTAVSEGTARAPERLVTALEGDRGHLFVMPGSSGDLPLFATKVTSLLPGNPAAGRPAVQGFVALFDAQSGTPVALVDGFEITRLRTAAASALATRVLARENASSHGILGAGVLAAAHLEALACVRPVREVRVWARDPDKARQFVREQRVSSGLDVRAVADAGDAAACDIVSTVTNADRPILRGDWLQPGCHVNLVGAHRPQHREIDTAGMVRGRLYVDSKAAALCEAGDLLLPVSEGAIGPDHLVAEIGEVLSGLKSGRRGNGEITLYKSLGLAAQDLFAAARVYAAALDSGVGERVDFP